MKNKILLTSLVLFLFIGFMPLNAQKKAKDNGLSKQLDDIRRIDLKNFGTIIENEVIVGYYMFTRVQKTGGGKAQFKLEIFDENLKSKKIIKLEKSKAARLVEMNYNGSAFFLMMTNKKGIDMMTYDKEGKKLGEINIKKVNKWERGRIAQAVASDEGSNATVYSTDNQGFIRQSFVKNKKLGYQIDHYDNKLKLKWTYASSKTSKKIEGVDIMYSSGKYIAFLRAEKKKLTSKDMDNHFNLIDAETGDKIFEIPMKEISDLSILGCDLDEEKGQIILNGEYFKKGKNIINSKSEGLYLMLLDLKGNELKMEKLSWEKDLKSMSVIDEDKGRSKENLRFYIHKVFISANGSTYVIAEQYKKVLSAGKVAMKVLASAAGATVNDDLSDFSIKMFNMVYMVFDKDFKLTEKSIVKKKFSEVSIPKGMEYASPTLLAHYVKANGGFDYQFSTRNKELDGFTT